MIPKSDPTVIFSVDVDGWPSHLRCYLKDVDEDAAFKSVPLERGVLKLVELLGTHSIKGTFFIPGEIARKFPSIVRGISGNGHEVACHGMYHELNEFLSDYEKQENSIHMSTNILENLTVKKIVGFRAPAFRYDRTTLQVLLDHGYEYSSSSVKAWGLGLYGKITSSRQVRKINEKNGQGRELLEIPIASTPFYPIPMGGAWFRILSHHFIIPALKYYKRNGIPLVLYIHPRDISDLPKVKGIPWFTYFHAGVKCFNLLEQFIVSAKKLGFKFETFADYCKRV